MTTRREGDTLVVTMTTPYEDKNGRLVVKPGMTLAWIDITTSGREALKSGQVWSLAKPIAGRGRAVWVIDAATNDLRLVCIVGRRHRAGRMLPNGQRWVYRKNAGRFMDKGEVYAEAFGPGVGRPFSRTVPPRPSHISGQAVGPVSESAWENWIRIIDAIAAGADIDLSTSAKEQAAEADRPEPEDDDD